MKIYGEIFDVLRSVINAFTALSAEVDGHRAPRCPIPITAAAAPRETSKH